MMNTENNKIIGIVGGMGPRAGVTLCDYVIQHTKADKDQEHLSTILMSFPYHIEDRTNYLEGESNINPAFSIVKIIISLEGLGASVVGLACNTSYAKPIYDVIVRELRSIGSKVLLVNMPVQTCTYIRRKYSKAKKIGIMSTNGTYKSGIYRDTLHEMGFEVVLPEFKFQDEVIHRIIYDAKFGIKSNPKEISNEAQLLLNESMDYFAQRNCDVLILGCTELSLVINESEVNNMHIVDSSSVMAIALIKEALSGSLNGDQYREIEMIN